MGRGSGSHPFVVEIDFPAPRTLRGVEVGFMQENALTAIVDLEDSIGIARSLVLELSSERHVRSESLAANHRIRGTARSCHRVRV